MTPEQTLSIQLVDEQGQPLNVGNILVQIDFFMNGKYRYGFTLGRTGQSGMLTTSYGEIEGMQIAKGKQFIMDFNSKLDDCDSIVRIILPSEEELQEGCRKVEKTYGKQPDWANPWPSNAKVLPTSEMVELKSESTLVQIRTARSNQ